MGMLDNGAIFKYGGIGLGIVLLAPAIAKVAGEVAKPLLKTMIKGGILVYDQSRTMVTETMEGLGDITAEAKSEAHKTREARSEVQKGREKSAQGSAS